MQFDFKKVLRNAVDGIFIVSRNQDQVTCNQACEELYDLSSNDLLELMRPKFSGWEEKVKNILNDQEANLFSELQGLRERFFLTRKSGNSVWVESYFIPVMDGNHEEIEYFLVFLRDLTEFKSLEQENLGLREELEAIRQNLEDNFDFSHIIGKSQAITESLNLASKVSEENTTVILLGPSGTGKELFARAIHFNSQRKRGPFVAVNCSAFPETLIESELFGHEKGAFTGADSVRKGKVAQAEGGTLFLDEIADLSLPAQSKVLRLLQENEFQPVGGTKTLKANVRFISATNQDLKAMIKEGSFREDLFFRLFVYPITLPALKDRKEDIPELTRCFLEKLSRESQKKELAISDSAMAALVNYSWPGNIRELQNILERAMILCANGQIEEQDLPIRSDQSPVSPNQLPSPGVFPPGMDLEACKEQWEKQVISHALDESGQSKAAAARKLGLTRSALRYKLKKYQLT